MNNWTKQNILSTTYQEKYKEISKYLTPPYIKIQNNKMCERKKEIRKNKKVTDKKT